jgi:phosphate transport system permease protein
MTTSLFEKTITVVWFILSALLGLVVLIPIFFICFKASSLLSQNSQFYFSSDWQPFTGHYGLLAMIMGSFALSVLATISALLWTLGLCILAMVILPERFACLLRAAIMFLATVPSVVIALVSVGLLIPFVRTMSDGSGYSLLSTVFAVSWLIVPVMFNSVYSCLQDLLPQHEPYLSSLGFNPMQKILWVVLPQAYRGIWLAMLLGFNRALSDTMIALMVSGNSTRLPESLWESFRTLTAHIALVASSDSLSELFASVYPAAAFIMFCSLSIQYVLRKVERGMVA